MDFFFERRKKSELQVGLYYIIIGIFGFGIAHLLKDLQRLIPPCMFRYFTGIPCPACGGSRTGIMLSHFQIWDALTLNPLFFILFVALAVWGINTIIGLLMGRNIVVYLSNAERQVLRWVILLAIPINWLYLIVTK